MAWYPLSLDRFNWSKEVKEAKVVVAPPVLGCIADLVQPYVKLNDLFLSFPESYFIFLWFLHTGFIMSTVLAVTQYLDFSKNKPNQCAKSPWNEKEASNYLTYLRP